MYEPYFFDQLCPHCGKTNEAEIVLRASLSFDEDGDVIAPPVCERHDLHCAACGLKINNLFALEQPKTRLKE